MLRSGFFVLLCVYVIFFLFLIRVEACLLCWKTPGLILKSARRPLGRLPAPAGTFRLTAIVARAHRPLPSSFRISHPFLSHRLQQLIILRSAQRGLDSYVILGVSVRDKLCHKAGLLVRGSHGPRPRGPTCSHACSSVSDISDHHSRSQQTTECSGHHFRGV